MTGKTAAAFALVAIAIPTFAQGNGVMPLPLRDPAVPAQAPQPVQLEPLPTKKPQAAHKVDHTALVQRYGTIVDKRDLGAGGLTAWTVEKNGRKVVLYTTSDGQAIISGVVWDTMTGRNLTDQLFAAAPNVLPPLGAAPAALTPSSAQPNPATSAAPSGALVGKYSGSLPESIKTIDSLAGIKEGKGGPADTLYVIVDPRCPYCRKAYQATREYVKRGFTIKWIPAVALGNAADGAPLAASILQAKPSEQGEILRRVLGNKEDLRTAPTKATEESLTRNLDFFFAAFKNNGVEQAGVPAAFFLDKTTGKPRMMTGLSETVVIEAIFGRL